MMNVKQGRFPTIRVCDLDLHAWKMYGLYHLIWGIARPLTRAHHGRASLGSLSENSASFVGFDMGPKASVVPPLQWGPLGTTAS